MGAEQAALVGDDARPTVEQALRVLGQAGAFHPADVGFAHACIALLKVGRPLSTQQRERAHRMLARYTEELLSLGIVYAALGGTADVPRPVSTRPVPSPRTRSRLWLGTEGRLAGRIVAKVPFELRDVVQGVLGGNYVPPITSWSYPATPAAADALLEALSPTGCSYDDGVAELLKQAHKIREAAVHKSAQDLPPIPVTKTDAWLHQRQAFWFVHEMPAAALDMEMGTGKSKVVVDTLVNEGAERTLIVCPDRVIGVWPKQFLLHAGREMHVIDPRRENKRGEWIKVPVAERVQLYDQALHECRCGLPHVLLSNFAASAVEPFKSWSVHEHFDYVIYDEMHKLKAGGGVWSKWAGRMVKQSDRRLGGTGTLLPQGPLDIYGQFRALDPGIFGTSEVHFRRRYAVLQGVTVSKGKAGEREVELVKGYQREDELAEKIATITYRVGAEVLDLPPEVPDVTLTTQLEPKVWKVYHEIETELYAELGALFAQTGDWEAAITAPNVLVKLLRLQQITGGAVRLDDGTDLEISHVKEKLLADDLEDLPEREPVVVFARFHHDLDVIERVAHDLGRPYAELSGRREDALTRDATLADDVVIAGVQLQSGGTGIDFTRSAFATYYSMGYSLADYLQSRRRLARPGQTRSVRFRHLVVEGTVDEDVYAALAAREDVVRRIGEMIRRRQAAYGVASPKTS